MSAGEVLRQSLLHNLHVLKHTLPMLQKGWRR